MSAKGMPVNLPRATHYGSDYITSKFKALSNGGRYFFAIFSRDMGVIPG